MNIIVPGAYLILHHSDVGLPWPVAIAGIVGVAFALYVMWNQ